MKSHLIAAIVLFNACLLFAQDKAVQKPVGSNPMAPFLLIIIIFLIFYVLIFLPQRKKQKETQTMLDKLKKGDKVVTIGGVLGTVGNVKDSTVMVKIADNTVVEFKKTAISSVVSDDKPEKSDGTDKKETKG
ncbi:MAG TPA: preprotein translocase subunit YajC [Chitinivibrionales bacterium]|nr:preprotein translocase subunit YajC [Chitinivibrionales bacterium]